MSPGSISILLVPGFAWFIGAPIALIIAFSILLPVLVGVGKRPPDEKWRGVFYFNPDDPAILVPKRYGIGYTLNFANRWSWMVLAVVLILAVVPMFFSAAMIHRFPR